jgi:hypothetical protein
MGKQKAQDLAQQSIFEQCNELIVKAGDMKEKELVQELGLTKDGRRRWKRRPLALVHHDRKEIAAALRIKGQSWKLIAETLSIPEDTCKGWSKTDEYKSYFNDLLHAYKEEQRLGILGCVPDAIRTLHELLNDRSGHVRFEAAQALITHAALDEQVRQVSSDGDFVDEINKLRAKAATNIQVNVGVNNAPAVKPARKPRLPMICEESTEGEVSEVE